MFLFVWFSFWKNHREIVTWILIKYMMGYKRILICFIEYLHHNYEIIGNGNNDENILIPSVLRGVEVGTPPTGEYQE